MKDLISVVVTCYNHEDYIEQCLRSIFEQSYQNIDLLVLNDGSTDRSGDIIEGLLASSPFPAYYQYHENMGVVETRNKALGQIQGDFFLFVDSDNFLEPDYIEKLHQALVKKEADIAYTDLYDPDKEEYFLKSRDFSLSSIFIRNYIDNCALIRREKAEGVLYDRQLSQKKMEDYDFMLNLIVHHGAKPIYVNTSRLNYRVIEDSRSDRSATKGDYQAYLFILGKYAAACPHEVYAALKDYILILEGRLEELIAHMDQVTAYVHELENSAAVSRVDRAGLEKGIHQLRLQLQAEREAAIQEQERIRQSLSYRLGNALITPVKYAVRLVKNPRQVKGLLASLKGKILHLKRSCPSPKVHYYRYLRDKERKSALASKGRKVLVYVIFEAEERLQDYKVLFLEKLATLVDETLIVVNGQLADQDVERLEWHGRVLLRENKGYDTAAFREGILSLGQEKLQECSQLLLVNDTNIGPMRDLSAVIDSMAAKELDFWGISFGEEQADITGYNPYGYIPPHLQSYFLVIEPLLLRSETFYSYWERLTDTDSRDKAIGKHETTFTKYFADLGYRYDALVQENQDSAMYIHPLKMLQAGSPLVKYTALRNYDSDQFLWQGLEREAEVPDLLTYVREKTDYPVEILESIVQKFKTISRKQYILLIDGVENIIPQCTRYRVLNKAEQLRKAGLAVKVVNLSDFDISQAQYASSIIIYRAPWSMQLQLLCDLAKKEQKPVYFDIDDLVFDTVYTDQLSYTQGLSEVEKGNYDAGVRNYGKMLAACDGVITSTNQLQEELLHYKDKVLLNRNLASEELIALSAQSVHDYGQLSHRIKIGYFSGSISHNENFELIKPAIKALLARYEQLELHIVGHLDIPEDMQAYSERIVVHAYVDWQDLPKLISQVDINLAPLVDSIFNRAKSEIKWIEAALVKVPTVASDIGAFSDMVIDGQTGLLAKEADWEDKLESLILSPSLRQRLAENAYDYVLQDCTLARKDEMVEYFEQN